MGMNQKTAFKILGLRPGASLDQAKKAFRELAKQYHPDRFSPDPSSIANARPVPAEVRLNRMQEINQAFHYLAPLLTPADTIAGKKFTDKPSTDIPPAPRANNSRKSCEQVSIEKDLSLLDLLRMLKKSFSFYRRSDSRPDPCVQPPRKSGESQKNKFVKPARFSTILNALHPAGTYDKKSMNNGQSCRIPSRDSERPVRASAYHPYNRFLKYMALKKQIDARRQPGGEQNYSRIEKIKPVPRVNAIGNKDRS